MKIKKNAMKNEHTRVSSSLHFVSNGKTIESQTSQRCWQISFKLVLATASSWRELSVCPTNFAASKSKLRETIFLCKYCKCRVRYCFLMSTESSMRVANILDYSPTIFFLQHKKLQHALRSVDKKVLDSKTTKRRIHARFIKIRWN